MHDVVILVKYATAETASVIPPFKRVKVKSTFVVITFYIIFIHPLNTSNVDQPLWLLPVKYLCPPFKDLKHNQLLWLLLVTYYYPPSLRLKNSISLCGYYLLYIFIPSVNK